MILPKKEATLFRWLCVCTLLLGLWVYPTTARRKNNKNVAIEDVASNLEPTFICPAICTCIPGQERTKAVVYPSTTALELIGMKIVCQNQSITSLKMVASLTNNPYVVSLDLSYNQIAHLKTEDINFPQLKSFVLRNNNITTIDSGAFNRLPKLKFLDISENRLEIVSAAMFRGLPTLERLNLTGNPIKRVKNGTFDGLISLKRLGLASTSLPCECNLSPLVKWQHLRSLRIVGACQLGHELKSIRELSIEDICYKEPNNFTFEMSPSTSQIVFEGDAISFKCKINPAQNLSWSTPHASHMSSNSSYLENGTFHSIWQLAALTKANEGVYTCHSPVANLFRTVNVTVITLSTPSCPFEVVASDKGRYAWPLTLPGIKVNLPCQVPTRDTITASRQCTSNGIWEVANLQQCPYLTKLGEILRPVLEDQTGSVADDEISGEVMEAVSEGYSSREWDVIYLMGAIKKLKNIQWNVTAYVLSGEEEAFRSAKALDPVVNQLPDKVVETFQNSKLIKHEEENFALRRLDLRSFTSGAMCSWRRKPHFELDCKSTNESLDISHDKTIEALIQMPGLEEQIVMSVFDEKYASLFDIGNSTFSSPIFGIHARYSNFTFPVYTMMQYHKTAMPYHFTFVNNHWTMQSCSLDKTQPWEEEEQMVFSCPMLGYFALLSPVLPVVQIVYADPVLWPGTYAGSALAFSCYILCITVYLKCDLRLGRNIRHALVNTWICATLLCFFYTAGIRQTTHLLLCQSIGMLLHYLTLSIILWMIISASILAKSLEVKSPPLPLTEETIMEEPPLPKSVIRFYLMGWGIGLIVCGISGALHFQQYANPLYCFLDTEPALATIGIPSTLLCFLLIGYYAHIGFKLRTLSLNTKTSVSSLTQVTQLSGDIAQTTTAACAVPLTDMQVDLVDQEEESNKDSVRSPQTQLLGLVMSAVLTFIFWLGAFLAVYQPSFPYSEMVFNVLYIISASSCGVFVFVFFVICRRDVHSEYQGTTTTSAKLSVTESVPNNRSENVPRTVPSITHSQPSTSNQCSQSLATDLNSACIERESPKLEPETVADKHSPGSCSSTSPRMNRSARSAPILTSRNFMSNPADQVQVFYDPRQSGAARRFFKKQRMLKNNNLSNAAATFENPEIVQNNFLPMDGSRSKISNVNIHVELGASEMNKLEEMKRKGTTADFASLHFIAEEQGLEEPPTPVKEKRPHSRRRHAKVSVNNLNELTEEDASVSLNAETSV